VAPATRDRTLPWIDCRPPVGKSADRLSGRGRGRTIDWLLVPALLVLWGTGPAAAQVPTPTSYEMRQRAERLRREQRFGEALSTYQTLVDRDSGNFEDRFWIAKLEGWTGKPEAAESALVAAGRGAPRGLRQPHRSCRCAFWRGHTSAAGALLEKLNRSDPADPEVLLRLGRVSEAAGNLPRRVATSRS
jgi:hypothetical protein